MSFTHLLLYFLLTLGLTLIEVRAVPPPILLKPFLYLQAPQLFPPV